LASAREAPDEDVTMSNVGNSQPIRLARRSAASVGQCQCAIEKLVDGQVPHECGTPKINAEELDRADPRPDRRAPALT
jgi:hypothetical protein